MSERTEVSDDWMEPPLPTYILADHPNYPITEVAVHRREGDKVLVNSTSWHSKHAFWVGAEYVKEVWQDEVRGTSPSQTI